MPGKLIPDVTYEIDGDSVTIEQGQHDTSCVVLHKIHLKYLADEMGVTLGNGEVSAPRLDSHLRAIYDMSNELYVMLNSVPTYPPGSDATEDVLLAHDLAKKAEMAVVLWGDS